MNFIIVKVKTKHFLLCVLVVCFVFQISNAKNITEQSTLKIENKAKQLGKIWNGKEIRRAIQLFIKASENWEQLDQLEKSASCLRESVKLSFLISERGKALSRVKRALQLDEKTKTIEGQVISHTLLFRIYHLNNKGRKATLHINRALKLSNSSSGYVKAYSRFYMGEAYLNVAKLEKATDLFLKALSFIERTNDINLKAEILLHIGIAFAIDGSKTDSLKYITESQSLWQDINSKRGLALASNAFGFVYVITNEKQKALEHYLKANKLLSKDIDFQEKAKMYAGLSSIYFYYGNLILAEKNTEFALAFQEKANNKLGQIGILIQLGNIRYLRGKKTQATNTFEKASVIAKEINSPFHIALLKEHKALVDLDMGHTDKAIEKLEEVKNQYEKIGMKLPRVQNMLGKTYEQKGDLINAKRYYESATRVNREIQDTFGLAESLYNLARLYKRNKNILLALKISEESISITESHYNDVTNNGLREKYLSNSYDRYELYVDLLMNMHELNPNDGFELKALQASEKSRSRLMRENLRFTEADLTLDAEPKTVEEENDLNQRLNFKKEELASLLSSKQKEQKDLDKLEIAIAELEDKLESVKAVLRNNFPVYSAIKDSDKFDLEGFKKDILDENTILLEFFLGKENSYVWLIGKTESEVFKLPKAETLENKIDSLYELITKKSDLKDIQTYQKNLMEADAIYWEQAKDLSQTLFGEIADKIRGKRLIIVPDGKLRYFPISALPIPNDESNKPFLLTNEIVYEPSASMLYLLKTKRDKSISGQKDFLVYSDAVFSLNDERLKSAGKSSFLNAKSKDDSLLISLDYLERLEASDDESKMIFDYFDSSNSKTVSGFDANRKRLLADNLSDYKVLHFATHGLYNEEVPELSGIVLSQFDDQGQKRNGLIWLQDIYRLKLSADLVVLSACDTGIGTEIKGEGLMSLTNGFLQAGAKSVVSSRWKVEDQATTDLMKNFYQILANENIPASKALQKAKIKMYENPNFRYPYFWASFAIHGDSQAKPKLSKPFNYLNLAYLSILLASLFAIFLLVKLRQPKRRNSEVSI